VFELGWDPEEPGEAASAVRAQLGTAGAVAVAVDIGFTFVKRLKLPPLPLDEKRRILSLEPERYFPVRGEDVVVSLSDGSDLVFGVRERQLESWIAALETLGPIELVEPAPHSLARALASAGAPDTEVLLLPPEYESATLVGIEAGEVRSARRLFGSAADVVAGLAADGWTPSEPRLLSSSEGAADAIRDKWPDTVADPMPHVEHCPAEYVIAHGAAEGIGEGAEHALTTVELARRWMQRERRRSAVAVTALVGALALLLFAVDGYRARTQRAIEREIAALGDRGQSVVTLQAEAEHLRGDLEALTEIIDNRMDPLEVLLAVSRLLPDGAYVRTIQGNETEWRLDGYARDAANLIPTFESSPAFEEVRFVRATNRVRLGTENYEDFSLALHYVPQP